MTKMKLIIKFLSIGKNFHLMKKLLNYVTLMELKPLSKTFVWLRGFLKALRNDYLQRCCLKESGKEFGKELASILDTKTRWSSTSKMISRFFEIEAAVR